MGCERPGQPALRSVPAPSSSLLPSRFLNFRPALLRFPLRLRDLSVGNIAFRRPYGSLCSETKIKRIKVVSEFVVVFVLFNGEHFRWLMKDLIFVHMIKLLLCGLRFIICQTMSVQFFLQFIYFYAFYAAIVFYLELSYLF